jgi:HEAT repeat protein
LCALREVDSRRRHAFNQYLIEVFALEVSEQRRQDVFQLEAAVYTVSHIAHVGDAFVISSMTALLAHRYERVRKATVSAFPRVAQLGDLAAIAAVAELMEHADKNVRHAALNALAEIAERGNGTAIEVVVAALEDAEGYVRSAAVSAFAEIAPQDNEAAIAAVVVRLADVCQSVRLAALQTLTRIVRRKMRGDETAIVEVAALLEDARKDVRTEAVITLSKITKKGDSDAIAEVCARFIHWHEEVRVSAVYAFMQLAKNGKGSIDEIAPLLDDAHVAVRFAAVKAIQRISEKGNPAAIVALADRLEDMHGSVRNAAEEALLQMSGGKRSDGAVISALASIAHTKFHLTASLRKPNEDNSPDEEEAFLSAAALMQEAKLQLVLNAQRILIPGAKARKGSRTKKRHSEAGGPWEGRKWQCAGGAWSIASALQNFSDLMFAKIQPALIVLLVILLIPEGAVSSFFVSGGHIEEGLAYPLSN